MLLTKYFTALIAFAVVTEARQDYCAENFILLDLPRGIFHEVASFAINGIYHKFFGCPKVSNAPSKLIDLYLFNREHKTNAILLNSNNTQLIDTSKRTIVLLHGWLCNVSNDRMPQLKDAYLERHDYNVIAIDWSRYSVDLYANVFCILPKVAIKIGEFLCGLKIDFGLIHLVGHSMGGQLSGLVGQEVQKQCGKKIGRITALDPAGPLYIGITEDRRLDEKDAKFVDVIHSNGGFFGYFEPCGTVDFYPNCGTFQPGCRSINVRSISLRTLVACSHLRSADLMIASIQGTKFYAKPCRDCASISNGSCDGKATLMGEDCPLNQTRGNYYLETKTVHPFA